MTAAGLTGGAVYLLGLAADGDPGVAAAAGVAAGVAAFGAGVAAHLARPAPPAPAPAPDPSVEAAEAMASDVMELLPEPVLLIEAAERDDFAGRRILFANAAAREVLRVPRQGALLVAAIRQPEVLAAVDESLFGRVDASCDYDPGGANERSWTVQTRPLPARRQDRKLALIILHDETDARRTERLRADFLANASHELRTPLAALTGFIETLQGPARDDVGARDRFLGIMADQAERMRQLIEDLLSLSRIELNEHVPPSGACDLAAAAADVVDGLAPIARDRGVSVELDLSGASEATVNGDRDQIVQVVQNLLDNALKYAPRGSTVQLEVAAPLALDQVQSGRGFAAPEAAAAWARQPLLTPDHADEELYAAVRVRDRGPGLAREHLPRLAERFYRVEGQKSGQKLGTGLGLAIVKHIVNRHRGGLIVESEPGQGAAFTVCFPLRRRNGEGAAGAPTAQDPAP